MGNLHTFNEEAYIALPRPVFNHLMKWIYMINPWIPYVCLFPAEQLLPGCCLQVCWLTVCYTDRSSNPQEFSSQYCLVFSLPAVILGYIHTQEPP